MHTTRDTFKSIYFWIVMPRDQRKVILRRKKQRVESKVEQKPELKHEHIQIVEQKDFEHQNMNELQNKIIEDLKTAARSRQR